MSGTRHPFRPITIAIATLTIGATAGVLFGQRSVPEDEAQLMLRASRVVNLLIEWLPTEADPADIVYDGIGGMLEVLDPHSNFLDPRSFNQMRSRQESSFFGVGIIISRREGKITVIAPMAGTPAASKGLRTGDVIIKVGEQSTEELALDEVVELVRGPEGTDVRLTILRPGLKEPFDVDITRTRIPQTTVRYAFMARPDVGYIRLSEFSSSSAREVRQAIERLSAEGMRHLVLDLRNNPGGSLDAAIGVSDAFLTKGNLIVTTRGRTPSSHSTISAPGTGEPFHGAVIVLVNEGSASASEIVAGAIQDHDRGLVLGEVTWGKGLVQTVFTVRDTGLALTTARYYTPSGRSIQRDYESFFDYITHRNGSDGNAVHETDAGRTVLGGGGITPDVSVSNRTLSENLARLYGASAFFRFAVDLVNEVPEAEQAAMARAFAVDEAVLQRFWSWVDEVDALGAEAVAEIQASPQDVSDVALGIRVEVLNAALGLDEGYRAALETDEQYQAALAHLPEAQDFWIAWQAANLN
ncbi:MAG: S41 family peptidase [Thermoanaerobaculales bacterium]|nr:S41 family peptidase [Thermoanaerobaculales bacterium]